MATKIDDASDFGALPGAGRQVVRDSSGNIWVAVVDTTNSDLELWRSTDGGSTFSEQDSANSPDLTNPDGNVAVAIDSTDKLHVVVDTDNATPDATISYVTFSGGSWSGLEEIDSIGGTDERVFDIDIAIDSNDIAHTSYIKAITFGSDVYYAERTGGSWSTVAITGVNGDFSKTSISLNSSDIPVVGYIDNSNGSVEAEKGNQNAATSFTSAGTIDDSVSSTSGERGSSIAVDSNGDAWVAYVDSDGTIDLAKQSANWTDAWTTVSNGNTGSEPSLVIDGTDKYVFYEDDNDNIVYDKYDGSWSGETTLETGTFQDVKAKWAFTTNRGSDGTDYGGTSGIPEIDYLFSDGTDVYWNELTIAPATTTSTTTTTSTSTTSTSTSTSTSTTSTSTSTSTTTSTSTSTTTTIDPSSGGLAFGEQNPTMGESAVSWQTWSDGAGSTPTVVGDADWGKIQLDLNEEGRSKVYDFGDSSSRTITVTENRYGTGQEDATLQIRGHDTTAFNQDDATPSWENYTGSVEKTWRYIQVRAIKES